MNPPTTSPEDRIPLGQKFAYATGMLANNLQAAALGAMMIVLVLSLKMNPFLAGLIGFLPRIVDAVTDPLMGFISDKTRSRWGRRRPYIFVGAILSGLIFAGMWQIGAIEGKSDSFYAWFFLCALVIFFLAYTLFATPFVAFGYEMTPDFHERTRLHAFANTAGQLAWIGVPWFWALMASDLFDSTAHGARVLGLWVGVAIIILGIVPAIFCRERAHALPPQEPEGSEPSVRDNLVEFFRGLGLTMTCRPFVRICAATFLVFNGFQLGMSFALYVMIHYVFGGNDAQAGILNGAFGTTTALYTILVIPLTALISRELGKRKTFMLMISLSIIGYALKWIGYSPDKPYLLLVAAPLVACGTGALFTLMGSMISDVCDYDELRSHQRREGTFGAIYWWMVKVGMALAGLLSGWLLLVAHFDPKSAVAPADGTMLSLRLFDVVIPIISSLIAMVVMWGYEITESSAEETRNELEARRGKLGE